MQFEKFLEPYSEARPQQLEYEEEYREVLEEADRWSDFFSNNLISILEGVNLPLNQKPTHDLINSYFRWAEDTLKPTFYESLLGSRDLKDTRILNRLGFHLLNQAFVDNWYELLRGKDTNKTTLNRIHEGSSHFLAYSAAEILKRRDGENHRYYRKYNQDRRGCIEGILNEFDTAIVLLNGLRYEKEPIYLIPSPNSFEHSHGSSKNSDFILLDVYQREVFGVQAKLNSTEEDARRYDPQRIALVDGRNNFNSTTMRYDHPWTTAGLISLEALRGIPDGRKKFVAQRLNTKDIKNIQEATKGIPNDHARSIWKSIPRVVPPITNRMYRRKTS